MSSVFLIWDAVMFQDCTLVEDRRSHKKLCFNIWLFMWLKLSCVRTTTRQDCELQNLSKCCGQKEIWKTAYDVIFLIFMSSLFHSFMTFAKKVHKALTTTVERWEILFLIASSSIKTRNWWYQILKVFWWF